MAAHIAKAASTLKLRPKVQREHAAWLSQVTEIARQDGAESCSMHLALEHDGGIKMDAQDIGPTVTQIWGDDDYEFWVRLPPASVSKLAFELLREKFSGQLGAVDAFRDWCKAHGVHHEFDSWV